MFLRLLLLLTLVPLVELYILLRLAERFDWGPTIALVILTGVLGAWLARREGLKTLRRIQNDLARGVPPTGAMVDGALILVAGVVLVTPGVLTDLCGFALLIPPLRAWLRRRLAEALKKRAVIRHPGPGMPPGGFGMHPPEPGMDPPDPRPHTPGHEPFVDVSATSRDPDDPPPDALP